MAASLLSKNVEEKSVSVSAGITALCGITEPGVYGVLFPKTYPLIGAMIGGGIGGLLAGILGMTQYVISTPGFISLPAYIDPTGSSYNLIVSVIVMIVAVVLGFVATYALGKRGEAKKYAPATGRKARAHLQKKSRCITQENDAAVLLFSALTGKCCGGPVP